MTTNSQAVQLYQSPDVLAMPEGLSFAERKAFLASYTQMKAVEGEDITNYLGKTMRMTGIFQHPVKERIDKGTGEVVKSYVRTLIWVQGAEKPFSLGSAPVAEAINDVAKVLGGYGPFPEGESVPFHVEARGKRPAQYYVLIVEEESSEA